LQSQPPSAPSSSGYLDLGSIGVLVLDDNPNARILIAEVLRGLGCGRIYKTSTAEAALAQLKSAKIDLVFADVEMPDLNGLEFVRRVRALPDPAVAGMVIVMVSAQATQARVMEARVSGANSFLSKPYSVSALVRCMNEGFASRRWAERPDAPRGRGPKIIEG
jgi:two-component system chemotaxis response regulator CheY